jgi:septal ring factor EnvC (AmiA/AmiB activator)
VKKKTVVVAVTVILVAAVAAAFLEVFPMINRIIGVYQRQMGELNARLTTAAKTISTLKASLQNTEAEMQSLLIDVANRDRQIQRLTDNLAQAQQARQNETAAAKEIVVDFKLQIAILQRQVADYQAQIQTLQDTAAGYQAQIQTLQQNLSGQITSLNQQLAASHLNSSELQSLLTAAQNTVSTQQAQIGNLTAANRDLQAQLDASEAIAYNMTQTATMPLAVVIVRPDVSITLKNACPFTLYNCTFNRASVIGTLSPGAIVEFSMPPSTTFTLDAYGYLFPQH